jgi:hypothetical protein
MSTTRDRKTTKQIDLRHQGCGGFYHSAFTQGFWNGFQCQRCDDEVWVPWMDEAESDRQEAERAKRLAEDLDRWAAMAKPEPREAIRPASRLEALILGAYREWSEEHYSASFMSPDDDSVISFIRSLDATSVMEDYELDLLERYDAVAMPS